jgi:hypothetical protein
MLRPLRLQPWRLKIPEGNGMVAAIIGLVLLIAMVIIAIRMVSMRETPDDDSEDGINGPLIHASGIYSIFRKSPRNDLLRIRPSEAELRKYLASQNEDINRRMLSAPDKQKLAEKWRQSMEENIRVIEQGDAAEVDFYYFDFQGDQPCPLCASYINRGQFVTRQEIFKNPSIIPPFHLGCTTRIVSYHGKENLRETTTRGMVPFFTSNDPPPVPQWTGTVKLT